MMKTKDVMEIQRFFIFSVISYKSYSDTFISWCWQLGKLEFQKFFWIPLTNMIIFRYNMPMLLWKLKKLWVFKHFFTRSIHSNFLQLLFRYTHGLHIWSRGSLAYSKKWLFLTELGQVFQIFLRIENFLESVQMTKYERIFDFKLHVYLPYLRSYGHF